MDKMTLEKVIEEYHNNDICIFDLLASLPADGLTLEEAFELYISAMKMMGGDQFFRIVEEEKIEL